MALEVTSTGTSTPRRSRQRGGGALGVRRLDEVGLREREHARQRGEARVVALRARSSIVAWLATGSEPSSGARSSTWTSSRVRSTWARNSWPSPAPALAPSIRPGMSAITSWRSPPSSVPSTGSSVVNG